MAPFAWSEGGSDNPVRYALVDNEWFRMTKPNERAIDDTQVGLVTTLVCGVQVECFQRDSADRETVA